MPKEYAYILDELIHVQKDEDDNQLIYHRNILDTLLELQNADEFIEVLAGLIKRLAVDHLHIVGDILTEVLVQTGSWICLRLITPLILNGEIMISCGWGRGRKQSLHRNSYP